MNKTCMSVTIQGVEGRVSLPGLSSLRAQRSNPDFTALRRVASNSNGSNLRVDLRLRHRPWIASSQAPRNDGELLTEWLRMSG